MGAKVVRLICIILGGTGGYYAGGWYCTSLQALPAEIRYTNLWGVIAVGAMIGYLLGPFFYREVVSLNAWIEASIQKFTPQNVIAGAFGLIIGLLIANLISLPLMISPLQRGAFLPLVIFGNLIFAYLGSVVSIKLNLFSKIGPSQQRGVLPGGKILDTSVIIDGRIADICRTGFIEGEIIIPTFVSQELRHIADSPDLLRRNRGRRGLDILKVMQEELPLSIRTYEQNFEEIPEVDDKLIKLAKVLSGTLVTNDYNLNKQATLEGVKVLNINELSNALKPVALPGEEMEVRLIKEGKERDQAVAYLDDGTMIVVEEGKEYIGETILVLITNMLQTPAGRVIFARPK